jgi:hypothetical protein
MICLKCGYESEDKSNYNKHLLTEKHSWYLKNVDQEEKIKEMKKQGFKQCDYCPYITKRPDNLIRHIEKKHNIIKQKNVIDLDENNNDDENINDFKGKCKKYTKKKDIININ